MKTNFHAFGTDLLLCLSVHQGKTNHFYPDFAIHIELQPPDGNGSSYLTLNSRHHQGAIILQIHQIRQRNKDEKKQKKEKSPAA